ncbi:retrovirus-related Pol polyprotein from transposon 297 [Trichonephila clavipes]|nr:retrovirus-related Pol polyprotein from transposon 297 [Trichonephila clavipes]
MAFLGKGKKQDMLQLSEELGINATLNMTVPSIKIAITNSEGYKEEFVKNLYDTIIANGKRLEELERAEKMRLEELERAEKMRLEELERAEKMRLEELVRAEKKRLEELERAEKMRLEELVKEQALKEKELQLKFDLERFKIESGFRVNDESNDSTNACYVTSNLNLKKLIPDFDPKQSDISLYLVIFERQAKRASIEKKEWVGQLLGLLPLEIMQFIAREPEEQAENYDYVKKLLLKRFKLSPEVFRQKFVQHQKKSDSTWKDFTFEITNYLDEWLIGLEINTFQDLKDLMVVDQLKKRANASMKDHFLDNWANLKSATQIAELFGNYEDVRKTKASVCGNHLNQHGRYLLGNKTAELIKGNLGYNFLPVEILNAVQTRSQVKAAREERGIDSGDAKKGEDEVIIVSSDAEDEILIPALQEYVPELALLRVTRENVINAKKIARRLNPYTNRQPVKCRLPISTLTTEFFERFGILVRHSSVYHPQSNPVERFHRTLKRLLRVLCLDAGSEWDKHLPSILLALRTVSHESTGYTPSELVYGKNLRTPETLVMEHWMEPEEEGDLVTEYMFKLINRLKRCQEVAINKMEEMQVKRKTWYDKNAVKREFKDGDLVLVLATSRANKLAVQWIGPGTILNKISETNYLVEIPGRRETSQIYHINMLNPYYKRPEHVNVIINDETKNSLADQELEIPYLENNSLIYDFEDVIQASELNKHLHDKQMDRLRELLNKYSKCFSNNPGLTNLVEHEIQLVSDQPVRTKPYRMSHRQNEILKNEINRMLKLGIIEVGESDYMSPVILVEGYWQIPLSKTAQRYAAFCTSFGTYRPLRMSFGLKNAPYFFSKLMAELLNGLEDFVVPYLDDIAIFSDTWESHIKHMETVLQRIKRAKLTIKPSKCKFAQQNVKFLGHIVGQGFCTPSEIKVQAVLEFPTPHTKTQIHAFLGIAGYYQKYINLFSVIAAPLTDALKGRAKKGEITWTTECENAFRELKGKLIDKPVLYAPNFEREIIVQTDASNAGMGAVLTQLTEQGEEHPILYLSKKFSEVEKRYCTTEKECASIVFAIKRLHYYLDGNSFLVMTDHNPLVWLNRNVSSNPRLMRWALALQPYNFRIVHRSGKSHKNADSLSKSVIDN